ncbi:ATP-binding cassette domain-containing protein [Mesomycoplasma hyopneumoniae]|uniref:ATP-binding cassette domain-containing protein n=1 Tax=Mesomycoplasma hyopneumoniae TaxID=2099 RepID=A0ABD4SVT4_MESHO|nr:ATP-binding cassette domain-containing protein [Mesomycoplasma hyopneumoniae]MCI8283059.1 ATP-binding cassette domain-containing protein [Mesomycoplasma hyopneumoniae]MCI8298637.1 ATP-binding cassette domain-containing protein [Mesomycoplasma hyopneumoniae]UIF67061.1 ATP-binding cassette domain-containing protein [Mesomycoplasma hyopneumoniae]
MIKIKNLSKKIADRLILNKINLEIPSNKITFVIGKSGIGKTTLINLIAGFTKKDEGEILFFKDGKEEKNPLIDVVFQDFNLIEQLSVKNNILIGNSLIQKETNLNLLEKSASFLNIQSSKLKQKTNDLSGGEKQRVAILRAFSRNSDFILLDEPTGNLDRENGIAVFESLKKLSSNKTILVVSHNLEMARLYADQIIHIKKDTIDVEIFEKNGQNQENDNKNSSFHQKNKEKHINFWGKFKTGLLLSIVDFKSKIITTILLIFSFLATIFGIVLFGVLNSNVQGINTEKIFQEHLDSVLIRKNSNYDKFENDEINKIEKSSNKIVKILPLYSAPTMLFSYNNNQPKNSPVDFVDESEFFSKRFKIGTNDLQGRFIKNENEIIISAALASELEIKDPIGKKIKFIDFLNNKNKKELLIVGVNNSFNNDNLNLSFVHFNLPKSTLLENTKNVDKNDQIFSFVESDDLKRVEITKNYYENQPEIKKFKLLEGSFPKNSNEIAISKNLNDYISFNEKKSLIDSKISSLSKNNGQIFNFKIVGIFDQNDQEKQNNSNIKAKTDLKTTIKNEVIFHHSIIQESKNLSPLLLKVFFEHKNLSENIEKFKSTFPEFEPIEKSSIINNLFFDLQTLTQVIIFTVLIIFSLSLVVLTIFYAKNLTDSKRKMIGVLKALGAKTARIFGYHWMTLIFIAFLIFVFGLILIVPITPEIYSAISNNNYRFPSYEQVCLYFLLIWIILFFILSFIYLLISWFFYRKPVVQLLK